MLAGLLVLASATGLASAPASISLPADFSARFASVCKQRGLSEARCACMTDVVLREVADEHLVLMLDYLENPVGFDSRAMQELDNDEERMRVLEEEIAAAQASAQKECAAG
jgi:hypothetical protein